MSRRSYYVRELHAPAAQHAFVVLLSDTASFLVKKEVIQSFVTVYYCESLGILYTHCEVDFPDRDAAAHTDVVRVGNTLFPAEETVLERARTDREALALALSHCDRWQGAMRARLGVGEGMAKELSEDQAMEAMSSRRGR